MIRLATQSDCFIWKELNSYLREKEPEDTQRFLEYINNTTSWVFVLEYEKQVVAKAECSMNEQKGFLTGGVVLPQYRLKGFGKRLFEHRVYFLRKYVDTIHVMSGNPYVVKWAKSLEVRNDLLDILENLGGSRGFKSLQVHQFRGNYDIRDDIQRNI